MSVLEVKNIKKSFGKTEAWYIVEAEQGAGIYLGFKKSVTKEEYEKKHHHTCLRLHVDMFCRCTTETQQV